MKEHQHWKLTQPTPGTFTWNTALGHTITITPHNYHQPKPPPTPTITTPENTRTSSTKPTRHTDATHPEWANYDENNPPF